MNVLLYARVSSEAQSGEGAVSIPQQISDMQVLVNRQDWRIQGEFIDSENYIASMPPHKGKVVNPSGERTDRPALLAMLEQMKTGNIDAIICWRDDRLVRHPRVAVALEDALDQADSRRNGRGKVQIFDATGAAIDRFTLSIKATIWREENKRRVERVRLGRAGTLKEGRWPASYHRLGYRVLKEPHKRGFSIVIGDPEEVQTVRDIYYWYTHGASIREIRDRLIALGYRQVGDANKKFDWSPQIIYRILRAQGLHRQSHLWVQRWDHRDNPDTSYYHNRAVEVSAENFKCLTSELRRETPRISFYSRALPTVASVGQKLGLLREGTITAPWRMEVVNAMIEKQAGSIIIVTLGQRYMAEIDIRNLVVGPVHFWMTQFGVR